MAIKKNLLGQPMQAAAAPAQQAQAQLPGIGQPQAQSPYANYSQDHQGVIAEALKQNPNAAQDPYFSQWLGDLGGNKLQGQPQYFYNKYAEQKSGEAAIAKQSEIEKQLAAAQFGQQQQGLQAGMAGAGLGKSGFADTEFSNLAANENMAFSDIMNRMMDRQQSYGHGLQDRWQNESMMRKDERAGRKNRRMGIISAGLSAGGSIAGGLLTPAAALNKA